MKDVLTNRSTRLLDSLEEPINVIISEEIIKWPEIHFQRASLTPLEKIQIGILIIASHPKVIVETGVWRGRTTRFISQFLKINNIEATCYGFDYEDVLDELLSFDEYFRKIDNVVFVPGALPSSLNNWIKSFQGEIDFAIVDAYHDYYSAMTELSLIGSRISPGGYIFCHDYGQDQKNHEGVFYAVEDFCNKYGFVALPFQSIPSTPKTLTSAQSVLLRKKFPYFQQRRLLHLKENVFIKYPFILKIWRAIRFLKPKN